MNGVVDNDVLIKGAAYGLLPELVASIPATSAQLGVLGQATFVVRGALRRLKKRGKLNAELNVASDRVDAFLANVHHIEPTENEMALAERLELIAMRRGLALDAGESQLCAVVLRRGIPALASGDKRAIGAIEQLMTDCRALSEIAGRVLCLEQLVLRVVDRCREVRHLKDCICSERGADATLAICFGCHSPGDEVDRASVRRGLLSYIANLREAAPRTLTGDGIAGGSPET